MSDFWSKRKAAVEAEAESERVEAHTAEVEANAAEKTDEELLEEFGLPDPDTMEQGDDFTGFMNDAVPARLKTRALRKLWRLNPVLANVDGLVDYGEDFTDAATVIENMQTTYQVGKGMLAHIKELARQAEEKETALAVGEDDDLSDGILAEPEDDADIAATLDNDAEVPAMAQPRFEAQAQEPIVPNPSRNRMQFHFEDQRT